jgi:hypothetical protein
MEGKPVAETWRAVVNMVLDDTMEDTLDDAVAARAARALIDRPLGYLTAAEEFSALEVAIRTGTGFGETIPVSHSDDTIRTFLGRVLAEMDQLRPWPEPSHQRMRPSEWRGFPSAPHARIGVSYPQVGRLVDQVFEPSGGRDEQQVLVLRLRSGAELAFVGPWWAESEDVAVLFRGTRQSPRQVMDELVRVTQLKPDDITFLEAERQ